MSPWLLVLLASSVAPPRPAVLQDIKVEQRLGAQLPLDLSFQDSAGATLRLGDLVGAGGGGRPVVLVLAYYECAMLCTMVLNGAVRAMNAMSLDLGVDYRVVTVSIDPKDTPASAAAKRRSYLASVRRQPPAGGADPWRFLVGAEPAIQQLADTVGFRYAFDAESGQYAHASAIMVLTPEGRVSRYLYGIDYSARDLRLALVEASGGAVGGPVDEILLQCFQWDPASGRYSLAVLGTLRVLGSATFLVLLGYVLLALRRDRRRRIAEAPTS